MAPSSNTQSPPKYAGSIRPSMLSVLKNTGAAGIEIGSVADYARKLIAANPYTGPLFPQSNTITPSFSTTYGAPTPSSNGVDEADLHRSPSQHSESTSITPGALDLGAKGNFPRQPRVYAARAPQPESISIGKQQPLEEVYTPNDIIIGPSVTSSAIAKYNGRFYVIPLLSLDSTIRKAELMYDGSLRVGTDMLPASSFPFAPSFPTYTHSVADKHEGVSSLTILNRVWEELLDRSLQQKLSAIPSPAPLIAQRRDLNLESLEMAIDSFPSLQLLCVSPLSQGTSLRTVPFTSEISNDLGLFFK